MSGVFERSARSYFAGMALDFGGDIGKQFAIIATMEENPETVAKQKVAYERQKGRAVQILQDIGFDGKPSGTIRRKFVGDRIQLRTTEDLCDKLIFFGSEHYGGKDTLQQAKRMLRDISADRFDQHLQDWTWKNDFHLWEEEGTFTGVGIPPSHMQTFHIGGYGMCLVKVLSDRLPEEISKVSARQQHMKERAHTIVNVLGENAGTLGDIDTAAVVADLMARPLENLCDDLLFFVEDHYEEEKEEDEEASAVVRRLLKHGEFRNGKWMDSMSKRWRKEWPLVGEVHPCCFNEYRDNLLVVVRARIDECQEGN